MGTRRNSPGKACAAMPLLSCIFIFLMMLALLIGGQANAAEIQANIETDGDPVAIILPIGGDRGVLVKVFR